MFSKKKFIFVLEIAIFKQSQKQHCIAGSDIAAFIKDHFLRLPQEGLHAGRAMQTADICF